MLICTIRNLKRQYKEGRGNGISIFQSDKTVERKTAIKNSVGRLAFAILAIFVQLFWLVVLLSRLGRVFPWVNAVITVAAIVIALAIYSRKMNAAMKLPWMMLIIILPVLGIVLYALIGLNGATRRMKKRFNLIDQQLFPLMSQDGHVLETLDQKDRIQANQSRYLLFHMGYPVYQDTDIQYFPWASEGLKAQLADLHEAKDFIFMEYHAIEDRESFAMIYHILRQKAAEGLDVRLFYDDVGSIGFINKDFRKKMEAQGIQCHVFNPMGPVINVFMHHRDHRKMTIVDGKVGFVGGYNLANEYFNVTHPYGIWKDTGVRLKGRAVTSLTLTFLEMWNAVRGSDKDDTEFRKFLPETRCKGAGKAYIQPYADTPIDNEHVGENVYMNILNSAQDYVYFITPYLIITDEMNRAFALAARRGIDVRIITPGIPDKKAIYRITRSYYGRLVDNGIRIFEYTPGFCHAKQCVSDDKTAVCGTINLDYRSLYHHFENGVLVHDETFAVTMREDFEKTFLECHEVTEEYRQNRARRIRLFDLVLRLFAPLL